MNHPEWQEALDAYVGGELDVSAQRRLLEHLKECASCRDEAGALQRIIDEAAALPRVIEPPAHLWWRLADALRDRPETEPVAPRFVGQAGLRFRFALATAFLVAVLGWAALIAPQHRNSIATNTAADSSSNDITVISNGGKAEPSEWAQMIWSLEAESLNAEKALFTGLAGHVDAAALQRASAVEPALHALDTAITEVANALRLEPGNPALARTLTGYYERKLELLRMAARLAAGSWA